MPPSPHPAADSQRSLLRVILAKVIVLAVVAPTMVGVASFRVDEISETEAEAKEKLNEGMASQRSRRIRLKRPKSWAYSTRGFFAHRLLYSNAPGRVEGHRLSNGLLAPLTC